MLRLLLATLVCSTFSARAEPAPEATPEDGERAALLDSLGVLPVEDGLARATDFDARHPAAPLTREELDASLRRHEASGGALTRALQAVFAAEDAVERRTRIEALAAIRDERAVAPLVYVAGRDASLETRVAAAAALGGFAGEAAERGARQLARDPSADLEVRVAAVKALERIGTPSAGDTLGLIATSDADPVVVRQAATDALHATFPAVASRLGLGRQIAETSGRLLGTLFGIGSGAYTLGLVGSLSPSPGAGIAAGIVGGAVIGGAGTYLLTASSSLSRGDALYLASAAIWSIPSGWELGAITGTASSLCNSNACNGVALAMHVGAVGAALLTRSDLSVPDVFELNAGTLATLLVTRGALYLPEPSDDVRPGYAVDALAMIGGFAASTALARHLDLNPAGWWLAALATGELAWAGTQLGAAWVSYGDGPLQGDGLDIELHARRVQGLGLMGAGLGLATMLAGSAAWQPTGTDAALATFGALAGNLVGPAIPLLAWGTDLDDLTQDDRAALTGTALGGLVGGAGLALLGRSLALEVDRADVVVMMLGSAFGAAQGFGWTNWAATTDRMVNQGRLLGVFTGIAGSLTAASIATSQLIEVSAWRAAWAFSGAAWGSWLGYWGANAGFLASGQQLLSSLVLSNLGLAACAFMLSPAVDVSPTTLAWVNVLGVAGMTVGVLGAVFLAYDPDDPDHRPVATANVLGSLVGLGLGALVGPSLAARTSGTEASFDLRLSPPLLSAAPRLGLKGELDGLQVLASWAL